MATMWKKTLHFLGLVEDYEDEYAELPEDPLGPRHEPPPPRPEPSNVRRIPPARSAGGGTGGGRNASSGSYDWGGSSGSPGKGSQLTAASVHVTNPTTFNEVEEVGERFRTGSPVIMNLAGASESVAKRLLDFVSGLIYGLDGRIERVGDRVFLLTPLGVDVSTEERARLTERGFFNQA